MNAASYWSSKAPLLLFGTGPMCIGTRTINAGKESRQPGLSGRYIRFLYLFIFWSSFLIQYVAERYRASTPEDFWMEFSSDDCKRFNWKAITSRLRSQRAVHDQELCEKARSEYGAEFRTHFSNRGKVMTDKSAIARRYLMLKGTQMDVD